MSVELDQKLEQSIDVFAKRAERAQDQPERDLYIQLRAMAAGIQENRRLLDVLRSRIERMEHDIGSH